MRAAILQAHLHLHLTRSFAGHVSGTPFTPGWGEEIVVKHLSQGCKRPGTSPRGSGELKL